jgi:hypothetical protein
VRNTLEKMGVLEQKGPMILMSDSSAAIAIASNCGMKDKTKHIALRYFQVRDLQKKSIVKIEKIGTGYNPSDIGTKALGPVTFLCHLVVVSKPSQSRTMTYEQDTNDTRKFNAQVGALDILAQMAFNATNDEWNVVNCKGRDKPSARAWGVIPSLGVKRGSHYSSS